MLVVVVSLLSAEYMDISISISTDRILLHVLAAENKRGDVQNKCAVHQLNFTNGVIVHY
jgi:hypothetical protein